MSALVIFHITTGAFGLLGGTTALFSAKGSPLHRTAGNVFFIAMLGLSASAVYLAYLKPDMARAIGGIFTFYLVATAWATVIRKAGETGVFEFGALFLALAAAVGGLIFGLEAANSETGLKDKIPEGGYYALGSMAAFVAALDVSVIVRRGVSGAQRIARHLWRMCFALLIAAFSFLDVLDKKKFIPEAVRETKLHFAPVIIIVALLLFWLFRVLLTNWHTNTQRQPE